MSFFFIKWNMSQSATKFDLNSRCLDISVYQIDSLTSVQLFVFCKMNVLHETYQDKLDEFEIR